MRTYFNLSLFAVLALLLTASCGSNNPKKPGKIYMPDMTYSNALEHYAPSVIPNEDGDSISARKPVKGTIPRGWIPADEKVRSNSAYLMSYTAKNHFTALAANWQAESDKAGASIKNPLEASKENLDAGKVLYTTHCSNCHGEKGAGDGNLVVLADGSDGPYTAVPPAYSKRLTEINDGQIFYSVSYGKGMMGGYGYSLNVNERWQVIHYIKSLAGLTSSSNVIASADATSSK